jgi:hypothetical protein
VDNPINNRWHKWEGKKQLVSQENYTVSQYVDYYHECRPHQGIGNVLLSKPGGEPEDKPDVVPMNLASIKCERRLDGLLKHYYHDAA